MPDRRSLLVGRHLLDRRGFLGHMASGMGGIALSALLAERGLLAADGEHGSEGDAPVLPTRWRPKPPHFPGRAKRVLHIFCTGAVSHLDTWDYKPALIKRHGQPMPGVEKLITFQGENGNLRAAPGRSGRGASAASTSRTCCPTWPSAPMTCASSTR